MEDILSPYADQVAAPQFEAIDHNRDNIRNSRGGTEVVGWRGSTRLRGFYRTGRRTWTRGYREYFEMAHAENAQWCQPFRDLLSHLPTMQLYARV